VSEGRVYIPALVILGPKEPKKQMNIFFASIDGRVERTVARGRCI
jgi:hypothetical protein